MRKVVFGSKLTDLVSISSCNDVYTVRIYSNEEKQTTSDIVLSEEGELESQIVEKTVYSYDVQEFNFKKGTLNPQSILEHREKFASFNGNVEFHKEAIIDAIQRHMDNAAIQRGYDSIMSVITYADEDSVERYQLEGIAARRWRSLCWATGLQILSDVLEGNRSIPTVEEVINELPQPEWPF